MSIMPWLDGSYVMHEKTVLQGHFYWSFISQPVLDGIFELPEKASVFMSWEMITMPGLDGWYVLPEKIVWY